MLDAKDNNGNDITFKVSVDGKPIQYQEVQKQVAAGGGGAGVGKLDYRKITLFVPKNSKTIDYNGKYYQLEKISIAPKPFQKPHPPIFIGTWGSSEAGNTHVDYVFYAGGNVNVNTTCSRNPYKLETEEDRSRIIAFFGQIRDRLIVLLCDKHERLVPDIMGWYITEADINKDIKVSDLFHFSTIKIQVRHLDHLFRIYIKSMGKDTVCRVEESKCPEKPAIEFINNVFNLAERSDMIDKIGCECKGSGKDTRYFVKEVG